MTSSVRPQDDPPRTLRQRALRGAGWTFCEYAGGQVVRLASNLAMTRLLAPEIFGVMALVNVLAEGLVMFSDVGVGPSIVRHRSDDDATFLHTAWTVQVVRGFLLALLCVLVARPYASFYESPELLWVVPVMGFTAALDGFQSVSLFLMSRKLQLGPLLVVNLGSYVFGVAVMIAWAVVQPSIAALVAGRLATSGFRMVASHRLPLRRSHRFRWDAAARHELISFGRWVMVSSALTFSAQQIDRLLLGKLITKAELGVYSLAVMLSSMPVIIVSRLANSVLYPVYAEQVRTSERTIGERLRRSRRLLLHAAGTAVLALALCGDLFFRVLYDARYHDAGWMTQIFSLWAWLLILRASADRALLALGDSRSIALCNLTALVVAVAAVPVGFHFLGIPGAIGGATASAACSYLAVALFLGRHGIFLWRQDLQATLALAGFVGAGYGVALALARVFPSLGLWSALPPTAAAGLWSVSRLRLLMQTRG